jgi:hypothetical protein
MKYQAIKTVDELPELLNIHPNSLKRWFKNYPFAKNTDDQEIRDRVLVGKPVIAAFMGISVKTLKRWFVKYPDLPIERAQYRCYALTNNLMHWKVNRELQKTPPSRIAAACDRIASNLAQLCDVSKKYYISRYVRSYNPEHPALKVHNYRVRHQAKTIEKTLKLFCLRRSFNDSDEHSLFFEKICFLSPPEKIEKQ